MNILLLSWRLPSHQRSGGAEVLTQRVAEHLVQFGHSVCWAGGGSAPLANTRGVRYVSLGSQLGAVMRARNFYRHLRPAPDIVVEQINTLPFCASAYVRGPVLTWFNQLARSIWWYEAPFPLNAIGYALEPLYLRFYRRADVVTISKSSADDLRAHGVGRRISVIPMAVDASPLAVLAPKPSGPIRLAFVGRMVASKRPDDAIRALALVREQRDATLAVIGTGDAASLRRVRNTARREGVERFVTFYGFVDPGERQRILAESHLLVVPSAKEGWGLVVTEANSAGTPAVAYDVEGLRDSVLDGQTGWICKPTALALANAVIAALANDVAYERVRAQAWNAAKTLTWDATARAFERVVFSCVSAGSALAGEDDGCASNQGPQ